jgi:hypothetical protein
MPKGSVKRAAVTVDPAIAGNPVVAAKVDEMDKTGKVQFSSSDFADFAKKGEPEKTKEEMLNETSKVPANTEGNPDKLTGIGMMPTPGELGMEQKTVEITPADKNNFIQALVTGERFTSSFSLFGGKVTGKFRSRRQDEAIAIFNQMSKQLSSGTLRSGAEQVVQVRYMLFACQLAELNGKAFAEMEHPLNETVTADGVQPPGWSRMMDHFALWPEGLITALFNQLNEFEAKYWTMVNNAKDQNFWKPEESS